MDRDNAREALSSNPDRVGECDRCHRDSLKVWEDHAEEGSWQYCERCLKVFAGYTRKVGSWRVNAEGTVVGAS